jgi:hypothetical protein
MLFIPAYVACYIAGIIWLAHLSVLLALAVLLAMLFVGAFVCGLCRAAAPRSPSERWYDDAAQMYFVKYGDVMPSGYRGFDRLMPSLTQ